MSSGSASPSAMRAGHGDAGGSSLTVLCVPVGTPACGAPARTDSFGGGQVILPWCTTSAPRCTSSS